MNALAVNPQRADEVAEVVKVIAHPLRLRIIALLCQHDRRVTELAEFLERSQSSVSQQLRILRMSGLVTSVREDGAAFYTLAEPKLRELLSCLEGCHR